MSDWRLLREYAEKNSEAAFAGLVDRHMKLVYGICRRDLGDSQLAEDATQAVFLLLARKAGTLRRNVSISGWLFNASRLVAHNAARVEKRRRHYAEEAARNMDHRSQPEPVRQEIAPWLNDALSALKPAEREVVLMRYFDDLTFCEIADQIGTAENTAVQRTKRAIEKMRRYAGKKEVALSAGALAALLADQAAEAAPASCHAATLQAIHNLTIGQATALAASSHLALLHKGVYIIMQATKYKIAAGLGAAVIAAVLVTGAVRHHAQAARAVSGPPAQWTASAPSVQWMATQSSDPATRTAEQQLEARIGQFIHGFNSQSPSEIMAVMTPDCISTGPPPATPTYPYNDLARSGQGAFAHQAPDASMKVKINSCQIAGNTAVVGIETLGHGTNSRQENKGGTIHDVYSDDLTTSTMTFVNTGGQWMMTRSEDINHTPLPYQGAGS